MYEEAAIIGILEQYGYFALFPVLAFGGPLAALVAGFLASQDFFSPWIIWPMAVAADLCADIMWYTIGRLGRERVYHFFRDFFSIGEAALRTAERLFEHYGSGKVIFFSKTTMGLGFFGQFMLILQGFSRIPVRIFLWYNFLAGVILSGATTFAGYYFGIALVGMSPKARLIVFLSFVIGVLILGKAMKNLFSVIWTKFSQRRLWEEVVREEHRVIRED